MNIPEEYKERFEGWREITYYTENGVKGIKAVSEVDGKEYRAAWADIPEKEFWYYHSLSFAMAYQGLLGNLP